MRSLAADGSPEASYLLFAIHRIFPDAGVDLPEAQAALRTAAEARHREALERIVASSKLARYGGDCYSYCMLAMGHVDLVVETALQRYDIVPVIPIIEAAGGVVTGLDGQPAADGGFVIAAANPTLHAEAVALIG